MTTQSPTSTKTDSVRTFSSFREIADFLWQNAERLRGAYKPHEYDKVILPLLVVRRMDCVLAPTKAKVLAKHEELKAKGLKESDFAMEKSLKKAAGVPFYNVSKLDFAKLQGNPNQIARDLRSYLKGFSPNARDIVEQFKFDEQITRLADADLLFQIVGLFAGVNLHPDAISNHAMGSVFEELIRRFNEKKNEEAGDHYTPREIIRFMVDLLFVEDGDALRKAGAVRTLYDPACGTGGMLSVAEEYLRELNPDAELRVYGQELNPESYAICKSDMLVKGQNPDDIVRGNSFSEDGHKDARFDYMLSNPPFGIDWKNVQKAVEAEHENQGFAGRFGPGLPRINDGALLFLLHMISKMKAPKDGGSRIAIVLNGSPLFTGDAGSGESEIRRWILEQDLLEAIVALPDQLFYNTGISTYVWVLSNKKEPRRRGKVLLINAVDRFRKMRKSLGNKRNELAPEHIEAIATTFGDFAHGDGAPVEAKVFDTTDFGFTRITVERPLRLSFQVTHERVERLEKDAAFQKLGTSKKKGTEAADEIARGNNLRSALVKAVRLLEPEGVYRSRPAFEQALGETTSRCKIDLPAPLKKAVMNAFSDRDETADVCLDARGNPEPDPELRDTENVPLKEDIAAYFEREVRPHVPDAWIAGVEIAGGKAKIVDETKVRVGYEIPITRHFYKYTPLRPLAEIETEIRELEGEIQGLLGQVLA